MDLLDTEIIGSLSQQTAAQALWAMGGESDRGATVEAVRVIDNILEERLRVLYERGGEAALRRLFRHPSGALQPFSAKIDIAFCTGLICERTHADLRALKHLRNSYQRDWSEQEIDDLLAEHFLATLHSQGPLRMVDIDVHPGSPMSEKRKSLLAGLATLVSNVLEQRNSPCIMVNN